METYPLEVKLLEDKGEMHITWDDDHVSPFTLAYIRGWCPCAHCQGHFQEVLRYQEVLDPRLKDAQPVGNYGMKLVWADGHDTGIYPFDILRAMCICESCDPEGKKPSERERARHL